MSASASATATARTVSHTWFAQQANALDESPALAAELLPMLAQQRLPGIGVAKTLGGEGGTTADAVEAIAALAEQSLTAAFVLWGHRSLIEYLLQSPHAALRERWLPELLSGRVAGATGLSNAIKFLGGIESLQLQAQPQATTHAHGESWQLTGQLPWVTNLRAPSFLVAAVAEQAAGAPLVFILPSDTQGLVRSDDLPLVGLRASNTAAIAITNAEVGREALLHSDANAFIAHIRPAFLALQCGMSLGLISASLGAASAQLTRRAGSLPQRLAAQQGKLTNSRDQLLQGLSSGYFANYTPELFRLRIALVEQVRDALNLELEASGGRAYLLNQNPDFIRRWRESAFIPLVTPSLTQLQAQLEQAGATHS